MAMRLIGVVTCCFALLLMCGRGTDESYGSEYYYYEEEGTEEAAPEPTVVEEVVKTQSTFSISGEATPVPEEKYGFFKHIGEWPHVEPLLTPHHLNFTHHEYHCWLQRDYYVKRHLLTAEELEELELEQEGSSRTRENPEDVINRLRSSRTSREVEEARVRDQEEKLRAAEQEELALLQHSSNGDRSRGRDRKLTFREQELLKIERKKADITKTKRHRKLHNLGPSCERLTCLSCRLAVREFGLAVLSAVRDPRFPRVEDLADGFCDREEVYLQYTLQVYDVCQLIMAAGSAYREVLALSFDQADLRAVAAVQNQHTMPGYDPSRRRLYWDFIAEFREEYLYLRQEHVCVVIGACEAQVDFSIAGAVVPPPPPRVPDEDDDFLPEPEDPSIKRREHALKNETCAVCHAALLSMEARVALERNPTERSVDAIVAGTCDRLGLFAENEGADRATCAALTLGKHRSSLGWILKMHIENIVRKARSEVLFVDQACLELDFCPKWVDPVEVKRVVERTLDAVYS